jgi:hypothetical protein
MADKKARVTKRELTAADFPRVYMMMRTALDAVEMGSLRWCMDDKSKAERAKRAAYIAERLKPIAEELRKKSGPPGQGPCPDGYYFCNGMCVPYQCHN